MIRKHIPLGGYMNRFLVDSQPAQDRGLALRIAAGSLNKERGVGSILFDVLTGSLPFLLV